MRFDKYNKKTRAETEKEMIGCLIVITCALVYLGYETEWGTIRL
ncbi:hypothetical protein DGWBC_1630 [Dehalogenimonas sp. WBC-2]|nr:hypothetical protein DGWBC_1630 [Dehalogenimonas sp. WBC-2]